MKLSNGQYDALNFLTYVLTCVITFVSSTGGYMNMTPEQITKYTAIIGGVVVFMESVLKYAKKLYFQSHDIVATDVVDYNEEQG